jgi:hypothetical protein
MKYERYYRLSQRVFRRLLGVKKSTFDKMAEIVKEAEVGKKGRKSKLCAEDRVMLCLGYLREYMTFLSAGAAFNVSESTAYYIHVAVEKILISSAEFHVAGKKTLLEKRAGVVIIADASESAVERPKVPIRNKKPIKNRRNKQKKYYSGKKKRHTLKSQIIVEQASKKIVAVECCIGKKHDFRLFKESATHIHPEIQALFDTGYIGVQKIHVNSLTPKRASKKSPLSQEEKKSNAIISSLRVVVENVIASVKRFKILSTRYRNRRRRFALRLNLIAGIHNYELAT